METWQREHITNSLSELVQVTTCTANLLEGLKSSEVLRAQDVEDLESLRWDKSSQATKLYEILQSRIHHYDRVKALLLEAGQSEAFAILDKCHKDDIINLGKISYRKNIPLGGTCSPNSMVYLGRFGLRPGHIAVKKLILDADHAEKVMNKIDLLRKLERHPNLVICYGKEMSPDGFILMTLELCTISLQEWWPTSEKSSTEVLSALKQTTEGMAHLHSNGIALGCLNPGNVLLVRPDADCIRVKISTFGTSSLVGDKVGKGGWSAPEVISAGGGSLEKVKADIFSLGCIFYFALTNGRHPFGDDEAQRVQNVVNGEHKLEESDISSITPDRTTSFIWLIRHMLSHNENERPTATTILDHHVFWSSERTCQFLQDISPHIGKWAELLDKSAGLVLGEGEDTRWMSKVCPVVQNYLSQKGVLDGGKFSTLVRTIIEILKCPEKVPEDVQNAMMGSDPNLQYWLSRFPHVMPIVWTVFQQRLELGHSVRKYYHQLDADFRFSLVGKLENVVVTFPVPNNSGSGPNPKRNKSLNNKPVQKVRPLQKEEEEKMPEKIGEEGSLSTVKDHPTVHQDQTPNENPSKSPDTSDRSFVIPVAKIRKSILQTSQVTPTLDKEDNTDNSTLVEEESPKEEEELEKVPLAKALAGTVRFHRKPSKSVPLSLPCTGRNCNPTKEHEWICNNCSERIDYGFDFFFYCRCGKTPVSLMQFKCTDPNHGPEFELHEETYISELISKLEPYPELNLLILGETGVGKSTWINGFINFLRYESLQEAEDGELETLIPTQFTLTNDNFEEVTVTTGADTNEVMAPGQAGTQKTQVYPFTFDKFTVRLIDTPGIGDPRGIDQDKENFQNILSTISQLKEIHGICILLKPNNAKLTVMFRFCLKGLLTYLHRDASKNIVFCFTNSRGTLYKPGDTLPALRTLLKENKEVEIPINKQTVYCYDSEAYRFLAAAKNSPSVSFTEMDRQNFATSWDFSIAETKRMLDHIRALAPHPIQNTLNLNNARELVLKMTRPLAEISRKIQINKSRVEDEKREIENMKENIEELKKKQMTTRTEIEVKKLDHPRTVCSNSRCVRLWTLENNAKVVEYATVCHDNCTNTGVRAETVGEIWLLRCSKFRIYNGTCRHCGHSYKEHLHIYYDCVQVLKEVENQSVMEALNENLSAADMKQKMIDEQNKLIEEYSYELKVIEKASVTFAYFLKENAITPYHDGMDRYLEYLIKEEEDKHAAGGSDKMLNSLRESWKSYMAEKKVLERQMKMGEETKPEIGEVDSLVKKLEGLKHTGKDLVEAMKCVNHVSNQLYIETAERPVRKRAYHKGRLRHFWKFH